MRNTIYFFVALFLILNATALAEVPFPFVDTFEADAVGGKPSNWEIIMEGADTVINIATGVPGANGKCLQLQDNGASNYELITMWAETSPENLILEYRVMFDALPTGVNSFFYVTTAPDGRWGEAGAAIAGNAAGLVHHNGGAWSPVLSVELGKWYSLKLHIKIPAKVFDVYVDGEKVVTDSPFRNANATVDDLRKLWLASDNGQTVKVYLDDIMVYDMDAPPSAVEPEGKISSTWAGIKSTY